MALDHTAHRPWAEGAVAADADEEFERIRTDLNAMAKRSETSDFRGNHAFADFSLHGKDRRAKTMITFRRPRSSGRNRSRTRIKTVLSTEANGAFSIRIISSEPRLLVKLR